jgi:hypothetical protein
MRYQYKHRISRSNHTLAVHRIMSSISNHIRTGKRLLWPSWHNKRIKLFAIAGPALHMSEFEMTPPLSHAVRTGQIRLLASTIPDVRPVCCVPTHALAIGVPQMGSDMTQKCAPPRVCLRERVFSSPITLAADTTVPCALFPL